MATGIDSKCPHDIKYGDVSIKIEDTDSGLSIEIETLRLKIFSITTTEYEEALISLYGDKKVNELVGTGSVLDGPAVHEKIQRWLKRWSDHNPLSGYVVVKKATKESPQEFVGQIILKPVKDRSGAKVTFLPGILEIGYLSLEKHWGNGYGKEFTHAMVHHLVPSLVERDYHIHGHPIRTIMATTRPDNIASSRVLGTFMNYTETKPRYGASRMWYEKLY